MATIIDRRLNRGDKTVRNRRKFIQRSKDQIKKVIEESISTGHVADIEKGKIRVKVKGVSEPTFSINGKTGDRKYILPGNDKFIVGDTQDKEDEAEGEGGSQGGTGTSTDDFEFVLSAEEFMNFIFDDLELPDMVKKQMKDIQKVSMKRTGFKNEGNPAQLDIVRSLKNSLGRRIGLGRPKMEEIEALLKLLEEAPEEAKDEIQKQLDELNRRRLVIPWIDPFDVRYRNFTPQPQPATKAVMFCVLDVSGSMGQREKDLAKRFFFLLHMFLNKKYEKIDIVFVKHHEEASEVDEDDFFNSRESGGTSVSTALVLTKDIIKERYPTADWNIYVAQCSDGDNYSSDNEECKKAMAELLPLTQYYAYVEIMSEYHNRQIASDLWTLYTNMQLANLNMVKVRHKSQIWTVFKSLFSREKS